MSTPVAVNENAHVVLVDGSGYIFRAYHALPRLTRRTDGLVIGAVAGFSNMLFKLLREQTEEARPTHFAVIFDAKGKTFRSDIYPQYKANRPPAPEDLVPQFPLVREATRAFGALAIEKDGYEADDIIATYATQAEQKGARVTIVSSDKDLMQLVSDRVCMVDTMKNKTICAPEVMEKFGVGPDKVIDIQALAGDSSDNVPGVPGIGVKTAALLINQFGDLDTLLARAEEIPQKGRREKLIEHADMARISRELVTLVRDMDLEIPLEELAVRDPDRDQLLGFLNDMTFRTLTNRVMAAMGEGATDSLRKDDTKPAVTPDIPLFDREKYECVQDMARLEHWIDRGYESGIIAVDLETDGLDSA
ncbi:MAG TPA: DNA polymerase I, partial [Hellea balneolensis]|nr:DNA polymerase I [Hellea balneolensis]